MHSEYKLTQEHISSVQNDISKFNTKIEKEAGNNVIEGLKDNMKIMIDNFRKETLSLSKVEEKQSEELSKTLNRAA